MEEKPPPHPLQRPRREKRKEGLETGGSRGPRPQRSMPLEKLISRQRNPADPKRPLAGASPPGRKGVQASGKRKKRRGRIGSPEKKKVRDREEPKRRDIRKVTSTICCGLQGFNRGKGWLGFLEFLFHQEKTLLREKERLGPKLLSF